MHIVEDRARDGLDVLRLAEPAVQEEEHGDGVGGRRRVRLREDVEDDACDGQCLFRDCGLSMARLATGRCQYACLGGRILPSLPPLWDCGYACYQTASGFIYARPRSRTTDLSVGWVSKTLCYSAHARIMSSGDHVLMQLQAATLKECMR